MSTPSLLDAVRVVKENERIASTSYADAARQISNQMGKKLFEELSKFEAFHYEKLTQLEKSLVDTGEYVDYQGKEFPLPPVFEIKAAEEPNKKTVIAIIGAAIELEKAAEKAYTDLAANTVDPKGFAMFRRLSEEEHKHYRMLTEAYWTITNLGVWKWSTP